MSTVWQALAAATTISLAATTTVAAPVYSRVGFGYAQQLVDPSGGAPVSMNSLVQQFSVGTSGSPWVSRLLSYSLSASYGNAGTSSTGSKDQKSRTIGYNAGVQLFSLYAIPLQLNASRSSSEHSEEGAQKEFLGDSTTSTYSAHTGIQHPALPNVSLNLTRVGTNTSNALGETADTETTAGGIRLRQNAPHAGYEISASASQSKGSLRYAGYSTQHLSLFQIHRLTPNYLFTSGGRLFRRIASTTADGPDLLTSGVNMNLRGHHSSQLSSSYSYGFAKSGRSRTRGFDLDALSHRASASADIAVKNDWRFGTALNVANSTVQTETGTQRAWRENISLNANTRRDMETHSIQGKLSSSAGFTQPVGGKQGVTYSGGGGGGVSILSIPRTIFQASTKGTISQDLSSLAAMTLSASANTKIVTSAIPHTRWLLSFQAGMHKRIRSSMDRSSTKTLGFSNQLVWRGKVSLNIQVQYRDGASIFLQNPEDPMAIPEQLNVMSRNAGGRLSLHFIQNLSFSVTVRASEVISPDRQQSQTMARVDASYRIGKIVLTLREQLSRDRSDNRQIVNNTVSILATRAFEWSP